MSACGLNHALSWQTMNNQYFRSWQIDRVKMRDCHGPFVALGTYASSGRNNSFHWNYSFHNYCSLLLQPQQPGDPNGNVTKHKAIAQLCRKLFFMAAQNNFTIALTLAYRFQGSVNLHQTQMQSQLPPLHG